MTSDTIFALASGAGKAGVAVYRLSGPAAGDICRALTGAELPPPRTAMRARLIDPARGDKLDDGLVLWFPAPASFTGEDVVEFHLHGGRAVSDVLSGAVAGMGSARPAEPGEFTRRAFENGKMDLTAAEGLADLVDAETDAQRRQAQRQLSGALGALYEDWRARAIAAAAHFEAEIDFSDEDLPAGLKEIVLSAVDELDREIAGHLDDGGRGQRLREGFSIAILGPPNAGKSSLLNHLAQRDVAIVSERAGTTRDVIEVHLDLGGYPVILADTAGLREGGDEIESEGVRRALDRATRADLKIVVFDGAEWPAADPQTLALLDEAAIAVVNKSDLGVDLAIGSEMAAPPISVSAKTGDGIEALLSALTDWVIEKCALESGPALTRTRHRLALEECRQALARVTSAPEIELAAEDLRLAIRAIGRITGRVDVEEILDKIFAEFCIGK
ncbi:MAG: tRNA uridine-5-carboxymethylaminomethyl(34) synthesis GTPase MnmE [Rhodospirillales bacterium]|nr:tRNA uridine-5-carboxymethylaminomethyl(34) synthesis GTPase MnmE [Rhodospirillales bacterium]